MTLNVVGISAALATFMGVWLGHVSVRKIEREIVRLWIPSLMAVALGSGFLIASLLTSNLSLATASGILAVTLFWDALEISIRQPRRIRHGYAPANPANPRHARILAESPNATDMDWLDRDPRGRPYTSEELSAIKDSAR